MKKTMIWAVTLLMGLFLITATADAQGRKGRAACGEGRQVGDGFGRGPGEGPGPRIERLAERLDLGEEQIERIEALHEEAREQAAGLHKEMLRLRHDLQGEMLEDSPDLTKLKRLASQMGEIRTQIQIQRLETQLAVRELLTPEQRDKMILMQSRGGRGDHRLLGAHGCPGGPGRCGPGGEGRCGGPVGLRGSARPHGHGFHSGHGAGHDGDCPYDDD